MNNSKLGTTGRTSSLLSGGSSYSPLPSESTITGHNLSTSLPSSSSHNETNTRCSSSARSLDGYSLLNEHNLLPQESISNYCLRKCCSLSLLFRFLSFITFQYIHSDLSSRTWQVCQILYTIIFTGLLGLAVNICPLAVFLIDWIACPMEYYDMCFIFEFHSDDPNNTKVPVIVMRSNEVGDYINNTITHQAIQPFDDLAKFTFLFILVSGALSYVFFCIPLIHHYIYHKIYKIKPDDPKLFHPFDDDTDSEASTKLDKNKDNNEDKNERRYFYGFLTANLLFLLATWLLFFCLQYTKEVRPPSSDENNTISYPWFEGVTAFIFFYSHWCTVISCFIFGKIMYGIQNQVKTAGSTDDLKILIEQDDTFIRRATKTLDYFQFWFFIHWVFYIVTSFLMIALSIEALLLDIRATQHHIRSGVHFSDGQMCLLILLSISNVLMFIYPCIRAAGITRARKKYILDIVKNYSITKEGYDDIIKSYVNYLQSGKFGFRLNIVCMRIPFDLNVAYTSILIGAFGIVLSILTSIAT